MTKWTIVLGLLLLAPAGAGASELEQILSFPAESAPARRLPQKEKARVRPRAAGTEKSPMRAFVYLAYPTPSPGPKWAAAHVRTIADTAAAHLAASRGIAVRSSLSMPAVRKLLARHGDFSGMDRVALIALRNQTGFDGYVRTTYRIEGGAVSLTLGFVDFGNGRIFRTRTVRGPLTARALSVLEGDLTEFAVALRQSYRATLHVDSTPPRARVQVNGRFACTTPCQQELVDGSYEIIVRKRGYKPYRHRAFYKAGDRARLHAPLYNPVARRYLNRAPAMRVDSNDLTLGYRYAFFNLSQPRLRELHFFNLEYLIRVGAFQAGAAFRVAGGDVGVPSDTFVAGLPTSRDVGYRFISPVAVIKRVLWEKFSFLTLWAGLSAGFVNARTDGLARWSFTADAFVELVSRIGRGRNFSFEVKLDLGLAYLGDMPYAEKTVSLLGDLPDRIRMQPLLGFFAGVSLRFVFWNGLF